MNPVAALAGLGVAAGVGITMAAMSSSSEKTPPKNQKTMNDGTINSKGGMVVSGPEGSIQLNKKDSIIAGTNLGGGGGNSSNEMRELKNMVAAIANRPINVSIDGKKVIEATTGAQPNTQGDESRKNSYRIS
jgi:predicted ribosomally synthesized peptide with SipW-like signal peptide